MSAYRDALPDGIRSRVVDVNGLRMHVLEAGLDSPDRPCVMLLHGFPELAFSWRKVMPVLADEGYHVVAPDQRGYGRTTGWDDDYDGDLASFRFLNLVRDVLGLLAALGRRCARGCAVTSSSRRSARTRPSPSSATRRAPSEYRVPLRMSLI